MVDPEPSENYEDHHDLYRGVKKFAWSQWEDLDRIGPNFFMKSQAEGGLSVDWSKYCQPNSILGFLNNLSDRPLDDLGLYGIIEINVHNLRRIIEENNFPIELYHDPNPIEQPDNDGHTLLLNILSGNVALMKDKLAEIANWTTGMKPLRE